MPDKEAIRRFAFDVGFDAVRFARAETSVQTQKRLRDFISQGLHGDMGWMAEKADRRAHPQTLWPAARSVIMLGLNYGPGHDPRELLQHTERGVVSAYARNKDYHDVLKKRLKRLAMWLHETSGHEVKIFVDTAPVMEKPLAQAAGLGWQGKHTNLVSREFGSWLFLGEVFTTLEIEPDAPEADHCGGCSRCLEVCPTAAFMGPYKLDARRCISYLTIEHKGHIPRDLRALMGNRIYGCDDCLAVCPWNKFAHTTGLNDFLPRAELTAPRLADLVTLDDAGFRALFAGSPIKRIGRDRFIRNVLIAIGNSGDAGLAACAELLLNDPAPVVRAAAVWAFKRLVSSSAFALAHAKYAAAETDTEVAAEWRS
ncbi:MAG: tRNA epoxyqueuosine(34) reductase QueG [Rhodospirillaceae bacterium]|nr:tRNA epoxyqueuosine(34) reductase QueG [Rhodospirillaceae bacterium]